MKLQQIKLISLTKEQELKDAKGSTLKMAPGLWIGENLAKKLEFRKTEDLLKMNPHVNIIWSQSFAENIPFPENPKPRPASTEEALSVLLRGISMAITPTAGFTTSSIGALSVSGLYPPFIPWWLILPEGSLVHLSSVTHDGCECPCPDGITAEFTVEWDAPGPFNPDLFSDEMKGGTTENLDNQQQGTTVEIDGSAETSIDFGNPALGIVNSGDLIFSLKAKPFFSNGFDDSKCCIEVAGRFLGGAQITSSGISASTPISESVKLGECDGQICCTSLYAGIFNKPFVLNSPTFNVNITSRVQGLVFVTITVRKK